MVAEKGGEFRGKTVEAAISNGLAALGLSRDQVEVEIVKPGSRGLLGIGAEDAVVHLTATSAAAPQTGPRQEPPPRVEPSRRQEPRRQEARQQEPRQQEPRQQQAPRQRQAPRPEPAEKQTPIEKQPAAAKTGAGEDDATEQGRQFLAGLLERMGVRAQVEIVPQSEAESEEGESAMVLNIVGEDLGMLIGRQSEVLTSLQFITRLMVNQQTHGRSDLIVDVNGYKAKRAESLRKLAIRTAEQVVQTGRTMSLEPMTPSERRIIHLALRNHPSVATQSVGEGSRRKVTVNLKKQ